jgi:fibronectin-binding autotransporter adhesin
MGDGVLTLTGSLTFTGSVIILGGSIDGNLVGTGNSQVVFDQAGDENFDGNVTGSSSFVKQGTGTATLSGTNTYSGGTTIEDGILQANGDASIGAASGGITIAGGILQFGSSFTLSAQRAITLGTGGGTIDTNGNSTANTGVIAGIIAGSGGLTKSGLGTLVLGGANSFTGGLSVTGGALSIGADDNLGDASNTIAFGNGTEFDFTSSFTLDHAITVSGDPTFDVAAGQTVTDSSTISDGGTPGDVVKSDSGTLVLDGVNTYTGGTEVADGVLMIGDAATPGASIQGDVTVDSGATLAGYGSIGGDVDNTAGGIVAPGGTFGSTGTLTVQGNYTQGPSSTLAIEINPAGASKLAVGGTASLGGTLDVVLDPGVYNATTYQILTATGGVTGTFASVTDTSDDGASLDGSPTYGANEVDLRVNRVVVAPTNTGMFSATTTSVVDNARQSSSMLLDRLGDPLAAATGAAEMSMADVLPTQLADSHDTGALVSALPSALGRNGGWITATGNFASVNGNAAAPGYTVKSGGFLAGIDRTVKRVDIGVAIGYDHSDLSEHSGSTGQTDTLRLALYGGTHVGPVALDATIGYAHDWNDTARPVTLGTAKASFEGNELNAGMQASLPFLWGGLLLTPKAGIELEHVSNGSFTENGASGFDLTGLANDTTSVDPFIGIDAAKTWQLASGGTVTPRFRLDYARTVVGASRSLNVVTASNSTFTVDGVNPSKDQLSTGAGIVLQTSDRLSLYADYDVVLPTGNLLDQTIEAGLRIKF